MAVRMSARFRKPLGIFYGFASAANSTRPYFAEARRRYPERPTQT